MFVKARCPRNVKLYSYDRTVLEIQINKLKKTKLRIYGKRNHFLVYVSDVYMFASLSKPVRLKYTFTY